MIVENKLTKKEFKKLLIRNEFFGSKSCIAIFILYVLLWRVIYTITKIGQLKTTIPIFLGISFLLIFLILYKYVIYQRYVKNNVIDIDSNVKINGKQFTIEYESGNRSVFLVEKIKKVKEDNRWFYIYFQDDIFLPIRKDAIYSLEVFTNYLHGIKPHRLVWKWTVACLSFVTIIGLYFSGTNAVHFNGALAWKINEWKTDTKIKLKNDNFYITKLSGIINSVDSKIKLEPLLMTNDLEIKFAGDGTIISIYTYLYGFDKNKHLQSGYLVSYDRTKSKKIFVHKQEWGNSGTMKYDPANDLSIVIKMLNSIPVKDEVTQWNEDKYAVMYKGISSWGYNLAGIHFIDRNRKITIPSTAAKETNGPSVSLYIPGKENMIMPKRYVYIP